MFISTVEPIIPKDRAALQHSEDMFSQMSSIANITTRLFDRSVLNENARNQVIDSLEKHGTEKAASRCNKIPFENMHWFPLCYVMNTFKVLNLYLIINGTGVTTKHKNSEYRAKSRGAS